MGWPQKALLWFVLVGNFACAGVEAELMRRGKADVLFGVLTCLIFIVSAVTAWLALRPGKLALHFPDIANNCLRLSAICFALALALGIGTVFMV